MNSKGLTPFGLDEGREQSHAHLDLWPVPVLNLIRDDIRTESCIRRTGRHERAEVEAGRRSPSPWWPEQIPTSLGQPT